MRPLRVFLFHGRHDHGPASTGIAGKLCGQDAKEPDSVQPVGFSAAGASGDQDAGRPAKCPELNPQENIWQFMHENWLSNRVFKSFNDIVDHCCDAWNKLIDQPWRIMSIGVRDWAYRS